MIKFYRLFFIIIFSFIAVVEIKAQFEINPVSVLSTGDLMSTYLHDIYSNNYRNELSFKDGDYMVSNNGLYRLRQTSDQKNIEIIRLKRNWFTGKLEYDGVVWQSDRYVNTIIDFEGLKIEAGMLRMRPNNLSLFNDWSKTFAIERLKTVYINSLLLVFLQPVFNYLSGYCSTKFIFSASLTDFGELIIEKHERSGDCEVLTEKIWGSIDGYGRRLQSEDLRDHLIEQGMNVKNSSSIQVGEKLIKDEIVLSDDREFYLVNCNVWKISDFTVENSTNLEIERIDIHPITRIPDCSYE